MIFVGVDWAEAHHDICVMDGHGAVLARKRISDTLAGVRELHELLGEHAEEPEEVFVGIEKDRGLIVTSMIAAGYHVYALNPLSVSRYRERHVTSGSKSDPGDAKVLADLVRTDRHNHREAAGDSEGAESIKVLARAHQSAIWSRRREANALRNALKDYYPGALLAFGTDPTDRDALAILEIAPTPPLGSQLSPSTIIAALKRAGRTRNLERRASGIQSALREEQLHQGPVLSKKNNQKINWRYSRVENIPNGTELSNFGDTTGFCQTGSNDVGCLSNTELIQVSTYQPSSQNNPKQDYERTIQFTTRGTEITGSGATFENKQQTLDNVAGCIQVDFEAGVSAVTVAVAIAILFAAFDGGAALGSLFLDTTTDVTLAEDAVSGDAAPGSGAAALLKSGVIIGSFAAGATAVATTAGLFACTWFA